MALMRSDYNKLKMYRKRIDKLNEEIIGLFGQRIKLSLEIHKIKKKLNLSSVDKAREKEVLENAKMSAKRFKINPVLARRIMKILMAYNHNGLKKWWP